MALERSVKIHVEAEADPPEYRSAVVYLTLPEPVEGVEILLRLREGVAVTRCWPRWPDRVGEREAVWIAKLYPRRFGERVVYSFGVRLDLQGRFDPKLGWLNWIERDGVILLEAWRERGLRAVVGPLRPGFQILSSQGRVAVTGNAESRFVVLDGVDVKLRLKVVGQRIVAGFLEYEPASSEEPFDVEIRGLPSPVIERVMVLRLRDLLLPEPVSS